jgi:tetratricopeptide (TPR) repeat protein
MRQWLDLVSSGPPALAYKRINEFSPVRTILFGSVGLTMISSKFRTLMYLRCIILTARQTGIHLRILLSAEGTMVNWQNNPDLSHMSDNDHLAQQALSLTEQIEKEPDNPRNYFLRANAYLDSSDYISAITDYTKAIELDADDPVLFNNRGIAFRCLMETGRAIEDYTKAIEMKPDYRDAHNNLGMALSDNSDYEAAIVSYSRAIELDSNFWYAYNNRGMALWAAGRRDDGIADYEKAKALMGLSPG